VAMSDEECVFFMKGDGTLKSEVLSESKSCSKSMSSVYVL
jgi:hypothetical protein